MSNQIQLSEVFEQAVPNAEHGFLMPTKFAAAGYGVSDSTIRGHKRDRPTELLEGQHWVKDENEHTQWTARGIIQLGFCTQSKQGEQFRSWAEEQIMSVGETDAPALPTDNLSTIDSTAEAIAQVVVSQLSAEQVLQERVNFHVQAKLDAGVQAVDPASLGKSLAVQWVLQSMASLTEAIASLTSPPQQEVSAE